MNTETHAQSYICPGETHSISRSVHLARLASFFPSCRKCPFRSDTGQLPARTIERLQQTERRVERRTLFAPEGVRGIYLNELNRKKAAEITAAFASLLWEMSPRTGRTVELAKSKPVEPPSVVVGYDPRPSSPDIVTGVIGALKRMGCSVIDIGPATKPCLWFSVEWMQASAGLFVGGAGWPPSWTGLDFVGPEAVPLSRSQTTDPDGSRNPADSADRGRISLNQLENRSERPVSRSTRSSGVTLTAAAFDSYEASLRKHFHALRPLVIVLGCSTRLIARTIGRMLDGLPCELIPVEIPLRSRDVGAADDPDVRRVRSAVMKQAAHLGVLIDDDGLRCAFLDERGRLISAGDVTRILSAVLSETGTETATAVLEKDAAAELQTDIEAAGFRVVLSDPTFADVSQAMSEQGAIFAGGSSGRYWFLDPLPSCDAILTLARILAALSQSDADFSAVVAEC